MNKLEYKLDFTRQDEKTGNIPVIVLAAGSSTRMNGISKQFINLCGIPAIVHTLSAFEKASEISRIVLVTKEDYIAEMQLLAQKFMITKLTDIVSGGDSRQESVKNGLEKINEDYVLIHDGARPLISEEVISRVCSQLTSADGVVCAVPVKDTIKKVDENGYIVNTVSRNDLFSAQTPQGVRTEKYREILNSADCSCFTDDASLLESASLSVKIVAGDYRNIKITTQEDITAAEGYLEKRGNE